LKENKGQRRRDKGKQGGGGKVWSKGERKERKM
jgi:hypothetical protein